MISAKFIVVTALLAATLTVLSLRSDADYVPPHKPLQEFPQQILAWHSQDVPLDPGVLQVLGAGEILNRVYMEPASAGTAQAPAGPVGLFIGYFPTQRTGKEIHSPQHCLPGAGWSFLSEHAIQLKGDNGRPYNVGEYLIGNGNMDQEVLYWYRSRGRSISSDYLAKFYLIEDALRYNRTDGALIRVITPLQPGETQQQAHNRAVEFTAKFAPMLPAYIPN